MWATDADALRQKNIVEKKLTAQIVDELEQVLSLDPRPAYQDDPDRIYKIKFAQFDVSFRVNEKHIEIVDFTE